MRRNLVALAALVALAVTVGWWFLVLGPMNREIASIDGELRGARDREQVLRSQIARLTAISDQEVTYLFALGQMETAIPEDPEVAAFLEEVNFLADRTGVELGSISMSPPVPATDEAFSEIATSISLQGQYFEILGFLYGLEAMDRLVRIDQVGLTPVETPTDSGESAVPPEEAASTTTTAPEHPRPDVTTLDADITAMLFTRAPSTTAETTVPPQEAPPDTESSTPPDQGPTE